MLFKLCRMASLFPATEAEPVHIHVSARFFGGVVEDGEACAHEEPGVVESHLKVFAEFVPCRAVGAVAQAGDVFSRIEIGISYLGESMSRSNR